MSEKPLTRKDGVRIELAVRRVDYKLDGHVPWRRRRQIRAELRSNLIEAASDVGAEAAVQQLGDLNELAASYLELYRGRFDFRAGAYWGLAAYALIQIIGIAVIIAFHAGVAATGSHGGTYSFQLWNGFGPYAGSVTGNSGFQMTIGSPAHVVLVLVAFAIGSSYHSIFKRPLARHAEES